MATTLGRMSEGLTNPAGVFAAGDAHPHPGIYFEWSSPGMVNTLNGKWVSRRNYEALEARIRTLEVPSGAPAKYHAHEHIVHPSVEIAMDYFIRQNASLMQRSKEDQEMIVMLAQKLFALAKEYEELKANGSHF